MGANRSKQAVNIAANISLSQVNKATEANSQTVSASENINVKNCNNLDLENIDFNEYVVINVQASLTAYQSNASQIEIQRKIAQAVKQISGWLSLGSNDSSIVTNLVTNITVNMSNSFSLSCNNSTSIRQGVLCQDSNNDTIKGIKFNSYIDEVTNCIGNDVAVNSSAIALKDFVTQKTSQVTLGLFGFLYWIGAVVAAIFAAIVFIVITVAISGVAIFGDPLFIFGFFLFFGAIIFLLIALGYFPEWWPYETTTVLDNSQQAKYAKKKNLTLFTFALVLGLVFLGLSILIFFRGAKVPKPPQSKAQMVQKLAQDALLKRELRLKEQDRQSQVPNREEPPFPQESRNEENYQVPNREEPNFEDEGKEGIMDEAEGEGGEVEEALKGGEKEGVLENLEKEGEGESGKFFPEAEKRIEGEL